MKENELRAAATCAQCHCLIGETGSPTFYRVTIERHMLDMAAVQRQQGLGMMIGGLLAMHMGPNQELTKVLLNVTVTVCEDCATLPTHIADLAKKAQ